MAKKDDRRSFPRIKDEGLALKLNTGEFDIITHTLNISASGIYCKTDRELPIMSRVKLILMLPESSKDEKATKGIEVTGVVVREHPVIIEGRIKHYDVAIFFENLSARHRKIISDYISRKNKE